MHFIQCENKDLPPYYTGCTCSHSIEEFNLTSKFIKEKSLAIKQAFGLHPQNPETENAFFLENLLKNGAISAIGETGFDFFTTEFRLQKEGQVKAWNICLELASFYKVPLVIHNRKALDMIFPYCKLLKKLPSVVFHSFAFSEREALSILSHGINAYFSFGKAILKGNKKSIGCVKNLPLPALLLETDAPYQTLSGEKFTSLFDIDLVYKEAASLRGVSLETLSAALENNFYKVFGCF